MLEDLKEEAIVNKVGGRFKLSTLIQKRMVALNTGAKPLVDVKGADKMAIVVQEILQDKIYLDASGLVQTRGFSAGDIARRTPITWQYLPHWPDYHSELPHGGAGRTLAGPDAPLRPDRHRGLQRRRQLQRQQHVDCPYPDGEPVRQHLVSALGQVVVAAELGEAVPRGAQRGHLRRQPGTELPIRS